MSDATSNGGAGDTGPSTSTGGEHAAPGPSAAESSQPIPAAAEQPASPAPSNDVPGNTGPSASHGREQTTPEPSVAEPGPAAPEPGGEQVTGADKSHAHTVTGIDYPKNSLDRASEKGQSQFDAAANPPPPPTLQELREHLAFHQDREGNPLLEPALRMEGEIGDAVDYQANVERRKRIMGLKDEIATREREERRKSFMEKAHASREQDQDKEQKI